MVILVAENDPEGIEYMVPTKVALTIPTVENSLAFYILEGTDTTNERMDIPFTDRDNLLRIIEYATFYSEDRTEEELKSFNSRYSNYPLTVVLSLLTPVNFLGMGDFLSVLIEAFHNICFRDEEAGQVFRLISYQLGSIREKLLQGIIDGTVRPTPS